MKRISRSHPVLNGVVAIGIILSMLLAGAAPVDFPHGPMQLAPAALP